MKNLYFLFFLFMLTGIFPGQGNARQDIFSDQSPSFTITIDKKDASSAEAKDGYINIKVEGGEAPYKVNLFSPYSSPSNHELKGNEWSIKNIKPGDYLIVVQDNTGASNFKEVKIGQK